MAKAPVMFNVSPGKIVLPDGTEIAPGGEVEVTKDLMGNAGVQSWIEDGILGDKLPSKVSADLSAENARLSAENADLSEKVSTLAAQVESLTADLAAATKPTE